MEAQPINPVKTILALAIPPIELIVGTFVSQLFKNQTLLITLNVLIFAIGLIVALFLYHDVLAKDWPRFRQHLWRNLLLAIVGVFVMYGLLSLTRMALKPFVSAEAASPMLLSIQTAGLGVVASLTTLFAPFTEEIIFRHALFYQWRGRGFLTWLMFIVSSISFGLVHWFNFHGQVLQMIPYMVVGAAFALIYYFSKNIWQNIMTHFFFDFVQFAAAVLLFVVAIATGGN